MRKETYKCNCGREIGGKKNLRTHQAGSQCYLYGEYSQEMKGKFSVLAHPIKGTVFQCKCGKMVKDYFRLLMHKGLKESTLLSNSLCRLKD